MSLSDIPPPPHPPRLACAEATTFDLDVWTEAAHVHHRFCKYSLDLGESIDVLLSPGVSVSVNENEGYMWKYDGSMADTTCEPSCR